MDEQDILAGKFRQIVISPEIAISAAFRTAVLSKREFSDKLQAVCIDEAHCISLWGGSFCTDYANLGVFRGRFPSNVPFIIASATLPDHILDDIRGKLKLSQDAKMVRVSNAHPNIALSVWEMKFDNYSMADLQFLIPHKASKLEDIDITLVYCNQRTTCEDGVDRLRSWAHEMGITLECIAFYHAKIGAKRKHELEEMLRKGEVQILVCTDAVGIVRHLSDHSKL
jgi:superfamily II DNA helicase RecQ